MPNVTVDDVIEWDNVSASTYRAQLQYGNGTVVAPTNPSPAEADWVDVPSDPDGVSQIGLIEWLVGKSLGTYNFFVKAIDSNGNAGAPSGALALTYVAPDPPVPRVSA